MTDPRKETFDAVRKIGRPGLFNDPGNILALNNLLDAFGAPRENTNRKFKDAKTFYEGVRKVTGSLNGTQVKTIEAILISASHWTTGQLAYGLATAWHEARLQPIEEIGKGKGKTYGKPGARMKVVNNPPNYNGQIPYGRGLVQLTWCDNYEWADNICSKAGLIKKGEILKDFNLVMRPDIAVFILVQGMETGAFTTRKLGDYVGERGTLEAFISARRVINGTDKAEKIAKEALMFQNAVIAGEWA